ncbi:helix-turn-helix domain-containing protein [Streptomyces niveus]|uniref:helix-turn-helix domain-containing protein n=1 Tax=Streptomyces niveus TaxID=193462 RepID=UPI0034096350
MFESGGEGVFIRHRASVVLRGQVIGYRGYRLPGRGLLRVTLPTATVTLVLGWAAPLEVHAGPGGGNGPDRWLSMIAGPQTAHVLAGYRGTGHAVEVDFTALGAHRCMGIPLHHLAQTLIHPDEVMGTGWTERTTEQLATAPNWGSRWALLDTIFAIQCVDRPPPPPSAVGAWELLRARHGRVTLSELTENTGLGRRRIQALFRDYVGLPPQTVSRVLRFQRALTTPPGRYRSLAELAAMSGYHDQAHMSRDFRTLSGHTPTQLFRLARTKHPDNTDNAGYLNDFAIP